MTEISVSALYQELKGSLPEIRLFTLLSSPNYETPLVGRLKTVPLTSPTLYEGLSYAWGAAEFIKPITINEQRLLITQNLDAALRGLRLPDEPQVLWVDAICINQQSLSERAHQVTLMGSIYSRCERDLLWLGPHGQVPPEESAFENPAEVDLGEGIRLLARIADKDISLLRGMEEQWLLHEEKSAASAIEHLKMRERQERQSEGLISGVKYREQEIEAKFGCELTQVSTGVEGQKPQWLLSPG